MFSDKNYRYYYAYFLQDKKRKATDGTPNVIKKLRLSENLSPANRRKKLIDPKAKTKLF